MYSNILISFAILALICSAGAFAKPAGVRPGDSLEIVIQGEEDLSGTFRIGKDGTIGFPLIGKVAVVGKDTAQIAMEIENRLAESYLRNPKAVVKWLAGPARNARSSGRGYRAAWMTGRCEPRVSCGESGTSRRHARRHP